MNHMWLRELICRLSNHRRSVDKDGYHYCSRCGDHLVGYGPVTS